MKMYLVGGACRDKLMGNKPKDFDFSVVLNEQTDMFFSTSDGQVDYFESMKANLSKDHGVTFFGGNAQKPEYFTARGKFPKGHQYSNLVAEFVLARKDGVYRDGRRPESVQIGTLADDLARRDFRMNAIAQAEDGTLIDPWGGRSDILNERISCVGHAEDRIDEDALRALRALRFKVKTGFDFDSQLANVLKWPSVAEMLAAMPDERKMDELTKMFRYDTLASLRLFESYPLLRDACFSGNVSLDATMKIKGFGHA